MNVRAVSQVSIAVAALLATACSGGNAALAPADSQSGSAESAGTASSTGAIATLPQPLPDPRTVTGKALASPSITAPVIDDSGSYTNGPIIRGTNATTGYGIEGITDGLGAGVYGHSSYAGSGASYGVYGFSGGAGPAGSGVYGYSTSGRGVLGASPDGNGVTGTTAFPSLKASAGEAAVLGEDLSTDGGFQNAGVSGTSAKGFGVYGSGGNYGAYGHSTRSGSVAVEGDASSASGNGGIGVVALNDSGSYEALQVDQNGDGPAITVFGSSGEIMSLDTSGDLSVAGNLNVGGTISSAVVASGGRAQIEDVGGGRTVDGRAYVPIDPSFARRIDAAQAYRVFLSPDGDCKGLFVAAKTGSGFAVRELQDGRSSVDFDYRVVAAPRQAASARLDRVRMPRPRLPGYAFTE